MASNLLAPRDVSPALRCALAALLLAGAGCGKGEKPAAAPASPEPPATATPAAAQASAAPPSRIEKEGLAVEFSLVRSGAAAGSGGPLMEGEYAEARFRLTELSTGKPARARSPAAWMDLQGAHTGQKGTAPSCREKIPIFLRGTVGMRPLVDLNSYFLLVLNRDPSISVIDPIVSMTGKTSLYTKILLKRAAADWVKSPDENRLYVSMPNAGEVAFVDNETFKVVANVDAGKYPTRVALHPDGKTLWVGNDGHVRRDSGVTVLDVEQRKRVKSFTTAPGHHELAFSADGAHAFVSNREGGTVTVIDARSLEQVAEVPTGPQPISIVFSPVAGLLYVADARTGEVAALDAAKRAVVHRIAVKPGLGPMRFSRDGRWVFALNTVADQVHVIDAADNRLAHSVDVPGKPYQIAFSDAFAYVRLLDSERIQLVNLSTLGHGQKPHVQGIPVGSKPPQQAPDLSIADGVAPAATEAAVFITSPADNGTYYYMEGMISPSGSFGSYGHSARAVAIVDRSLRETEPGVYSARLRVPSAGKLDVAFMVENPRIIECFQAETAKNPALKPAVDAVEVSYLDVPLQVKTGDSLALRFRIVDPEGNAKKGLSDVGVRYFLAPGQLRTDLPAVEVEDGVYSARLQFPKDGVYYVHVAVPSLRVGFGQLPHRTFIARDAAAPEPPRPLPASGGRERAEKRSAAATP